MKKLIKKIDNKIFFTRDILLLLAGALLLRLILSPFGTLSIDQNTFIAWGNRLVEVGTQSFYREWSDYLPGYLYVLGGLSYLYQLIGLNQVILFKLPAILADIATGALIYLTLKRMGKDKMAFWATALFLFNPATLSNSTLWGQVDVFSGLLPIASFYFLPISWPISATLLSIGASIKPQAALAAPIILWLMLIERRSFFKIASYIFFSAVVYLLLFLPFSSGNPILFIAERLGATMGQYPYGSVNAFNFWGFWGFWKPESMGFPNETQIGYALFALFALICFLRYRLKNAGEYIMLSVLLAANFLFFTRMHERHLLPALIPLTVASGVYPILFIPLVIFSVVYAANMFYAYQWVTFDFLEVFPSWMVVIFILLNLLAFGLLLFSRIEKQYNFFGLSTKLKSQNISKLIISWITSFWKKPLIDETDKKEKGLRKNFTFAAIFSILVVGLLSRSINLGNPPEMYFDEVYHAFTAKVIKSGDSKAWEWWNPHPEGFAYEWTHPPVSKYFMVLGMSVFGENAFGWRFPAAIASTVSIFLMFLIGKKLFGAKVGLIASALFALDGLSLVLGRIGMNDSYLVMFLLFTLLFFLDKKYFLSSVFFGFAISTKWSAFWFLPVLSVLYFLQNPKKPLPGVTLLVPFAAFFLSVSQLNEQSALIALRVYAVVWVALSAVLVIRKRFEVWGFSLIPFLIYLISYIPQFRFHDWDIFWGMQRQMWWYHTGLVATHPFTSPWWSWPVMSRPLWLYTSGVVDGVVGNIYAMGNPIIFWSGLVALIYALFQALKNKDKKLLFVVAAYCAVFVPWAFSPRIMFLYHYYPAIPFLVLGLAYSLSKLKNSRLMLFLTVSLLIFVYFFPHLTGMKIPVALSDSYYWLPGWR